MVRDIVKEPDPILMEKCRMIDPIHETHIIQDMLDTAYANIENCVGLAANQVGFDVRAILVKNEHDEFIPYMNPVILKGIGQRYNAMERCMSVDGERPTKRFPKVLIRYTDMNNVRRTETIHDRFIAQIFQHEVDHTNGILIGQGK